MSVDEADQSYITVSHLDETVRWPIELKEQSGELFRLSGMARLKSGLLNDGSWFELLIGPQPKITYWGNQEIQRIDHAILTG